jgi:hypothetical protein
MPQPESADVWTQLPRDESRRRLDSIGLVLSESDRILICKHCRYALQPSGQTVSKHLWEKHLLPARDRAGLNAFIRSLALQDPNTVPKRPDGSSAQPHLSVHDGFACSQCDYRTTSENLLKRHLSQAHDRHSPRTSEIHAQSWSKVRLQSWTQNGKREFWVIATLDEEETRPTEQSPRKKRKLSEIHLAETERVAQRHRSLRDGTPIDPLHLSNWMRRTGWTQMFSGVDRRILLQLAQPPVLHSERLSLRDGGPRSIVYSLADERKLAKIGAAIDRFFDRCEDTVRHTDHSLLCWLRSQYLGKTYKAPFELAGRKATQTRYRSLWKKMIFFCVRAYAVRSRDASGESLNLPFSTPAWQAVRTLWEAVSETTDEPMDHRESRQASPCSPPSNRGRRAESEICREAGRRRSQALSSLTAAACSEDSEGEVASQCAHDSDATDDEYVQASDIESEGGSPDTSSSPRDSCSDDDATTCQPQGVRRLASAKSADFDPLLTRAACFCAFLCMEPFHDGKSGTTIMVYFAGVLAIGQDGITFERPGNYTSKLSALIHSARLCMLEATLPRFPHPDISWGHRPSLHQDKALNKVREGFLCRGSAAPVGELLSLRAYGRVVARTDGPAFRVDWTDDGGSVKWEDGTLTMREFRALGHRALCLVQESLDALLVSFRPVLDLNVLCDRISNHTYAYSFVQDPRNNIDSAFLEYSETICADSNLGLVTRNGWNMRAVRRFLRQEEALLERIMLMMYLRGGQAPRVTELMSLMCWNGSSTSRGLYIHEGVMMYVTRHSKARRATNQEFQVARYLPASDSLALATYLIYIRPFTEMVHRSCFDSDRDRNLLFCSLEEPNKPWTANRLTSVLRELTKDVAGPPLGVRAYRQLSIAVTERHLVHVRSPFNRFDDKTAQADVGVAFAWQSGHRPLQRGVSYGIDAAYPDSLQPALLRVYRWVSTEWHKFLDCDGNDGYTDKDSSSPVGGGVVSKTLWRRGQSENGPATQSKLSRLENDRAQRRAVGSRKAPFGPTRVAASGSQARTETNLGLHGKSDCIEISDDHETDSSPLPAAVPSQSRRNIRRSRGSPCSSSSTRNGNGISTAADRQDSVVHQLGSPEFPHVNNARPHLRLDTRNDDLSYQFEYLAEYKLLICKFHGHAVRNIKKHLESHMGSRVAKRVAAQKFDGLELMTPELINMPITGTTPFPCLSPPVDAYLCLSSRGACGFISKATTSMAKHRSLAHGDTSRLEKHKQHKKVKVQSFSASTNSPRWFVVKE